MKKYSLLINVAMVLIGAVGLLFFYFSRSSSPLTVPPETINVKEEKELILVAVATKKLQTKSIIQSGDYTLKTIQVAKGSREIKEFNIDGINPTGWAATQSLDEGAFITPGSLVKPGSDEYIRMFIEQGKVIYSFDIEMKDDYLMTNINAGDGVDIFLSYSIEKNSDGSSQIISPSRTVEGNRFKPLMKNKKVLALRPAKPNEGTNRMILAGKIVVELLASEVKLLKGLEGKEIYVFPSVSDVNDMGKPTLAVNEEHWPVDDDIIFKRDTGTIEVKGITELRG